jgi:alpha-D-xyloside xylohydrolase
VRYAEGEQLPENATPMVVGSFTGAATSRVEQAQDRVVYRTAEAIIEVALRPFTLTLTVKSLDGRVVCEVGGREKNNMSQWDAYNTGICRSVPDGHPLAVETFALRPQEAIYGFGEKFIGLDKRGQTIYVNALEALGVTTPRSYKNVPFFASTNGYGVFVNTSARMTAYVGSRAAADVQIAVEDDFLDYYIILGDLKQVLDRYTDITGKGALPPKWSFGYWQSKISYSSADETLQIVRDFRAADVPVDVIHLDTFWFREDWRCDLEFDPERFPDPAGYMSEMADLGVKVSLWQLPYIPEGSALYDELAAAGGFVRTEDGDIYDIGVCLTPGFNGRVGCIDFTNPAGVEVYKRHLRRLFEMGARVIKVDFGEQAPLDGVYHDGTPGHRAHNLYPLLYNEAVAEVTRECTGENIIWARSTWAGSQRYPVHWGGDSTPNWHNIAPQMAGGLSFGLSGFQFWSQDIGGFIGMTDGDLLVRWFQAGMFNSHSRIHGAGTRELTAFGGDVLNICRDFLHLRYALLPYIYAQAATCVERSLPMMRPLALEFQHDPTTWPIYDQWLFGDSLLVAPIMDPSGRRRVYMPDGRWTDWWTGQRLEGRRWIDVEVPLERMPLYMREGAVIPIGPRMLHVGERPTDSITLRVAPLTSDGERVHGVALDHGFAQSRYQARAGRHEVVVTGGGGVRFSLDVSGSEPVDLRVH